MTCVIPECNHNTQSKKKKEKIDERKVGQAHIFNACFLPSLDRKKKMLSCNQHSTPTLTRLLHPPTDTYMPRSTCIQSNTHCCWRVQLGEGAGSWSWWGILHPSMPSHHPSWPCQLSLVVKEKTFPSRGVYGAALNNRYQKPPAWNCPSATGRVSPVRRDQRDTASIRVLCI